MSKDHKLDDAELANVAGAGGVLDDADIDDQKPGPPPPGDGTNLDDASQQEDVGGGLTDPNLR